jgi:mycothiol system anti-sigma-R factor
MSAPDFHDAHSVFGSSECSDAVGELYSYLDRAMDPERWRQVEIHLSRCPPCVRAFAFEARLRQVVAQRCQEVVPVMLVRRVRIAVMAEQRREASSDVECDVT